MSARVRMRAMSARVRMRAMNDSPAEAPPPPATPGSSLFRARALEQLAAPDRSDLAARIVRPAAWVALLSMALVLLGGLAASAFVSVPVQVSAAGALVADAPPVALRLKQPVTLLGYSVQPNDDVEAGQVLARLAGGVLTAPMAGRIASLGQPPGSAVPAGVTLLTLLPDTAPVKAVIYARPDVARSVRPGMAVEVSTESVTTPSLHGHITAVGTRPKSVAAMSAMLGEARLVDALQDAGATIEMTAVIDAAPAGIANLPCRAVITVGAHRVLDLITPGREGD